MQLKALITIALLSCTAQCIQFSYKVCDNSGKPTGPVRTKDLEAGDCVSLDSIAPHICKVYSCTPYKQSGCYVRGLVPHGYVQCEQN
ncbi:hypothetical protein BC940DRAFT_293405 [Gongronella butleri]|nr:hypothetical protein BC940DRAFT_293405 [Gongronella butleri]